MNKLFYAVLIIIIGGFLTDISAQQAVTVKGRIINSSTKKPVEFGTLAVAETRTKASVDPSGNYTVTLPKPGKYTFIITSSGLRPLKTEVNVTGNTDKDFVLSPVEVKGGQLTITGDRDVQKISRYTMTSREIKDVPAAFGDSVSALTALPGVIKSSGFFGQLVIRGADSNSNKYYIDGIPVYNPQHFGGIHSVISNDIMSEIDLYASAFPAQFGGANAAVININTVDEIKDFGGVTEVGIISSNIYLQMPLDYYSDKSETADKSTDAVKENPGYIIAAARYGYLPLFIPPIYQILTGDKIASVPEYYDYQFKAKYYFNSRHSMTLLFMGSKDYIDFINNFSTPDEFDPILKNFQFKNDVVSNSGGLYYTYQPSKKFKNTLMTYASLNDSYNYLNVEGAAAWVSGLNYVSKPYIYGLKDYLKFAWLDGAAELRAGTEFTYYDFQTDGFNLIPKEFDGLSIPDFANPDEFILEPNKASFVNRAAGGYIENKFTFSGLTIVPGVRADYLDRSNVYTIDPRGMISFEIPTETTISIAGGQYSSFLQTNSYVFNNASYLALQGKALKPERAIHRSGGIEQKFGLYSLKLEGFYNNFFNLYEPDGTMPTGLRGYSSGRQRAYGAEIMLRRDREELRRGLYGWINYTYTRSKRKTGLPVTPENPYGDTYLNFSKEQEHAFKLVAGYVLNKHTFSSRFQYYTSFPYTPISGAVLSPDPTPSGSQDRYARSFEGSIPYSKRFDPAHRLDLRYSYRTDYKWGYVSWYIEAINVYNYQPIDSESFNYRTGAVTLKKQDGLALIPNFGVEVKF